MPAFAATRPVNPPGSSPALSADQLWAGLGIKARDPTRFVPAITACRVEHEDDDKVRCALAGSLCARGGTSSGSRCRSSPAGDDEH